MSLIEPIAVIVSVISVWLATRRSLWHYPYAFASVAIYAWIFFRVKLYADVALQGVFAVTLAYGFVQWRRSRDEQGEVLVARTTVVEIAIAVLAAALVSLALGRFMATRTDAALPWLDSALLAASLVGSFWGARRRIEAWWVWIVVDLVYVGVYVYKDLFWTGGLYAAFVVLAFIGLRRWETARTEQQARHAAVPPLNRREWSTEAAT